MKRRYPQAPVAAVGVIVRDGDRVLLVERGRDPSKGFWTFPGGAIELGEEARDAARREVLEETGLEVELSDVAAVVDNIVRDKAGRIAYHYVIVDFFARVVGGTLRPGSDGAAVRWVQLADLGDLPVTEKARQILHQLLTSPGP